MQNMSVHTRTIFISPFQARVLCFFPLPAHHLHSDLQFQPLDSLDRNSGLRGTPELPCNSKQ